MIKHATMNIELFTSPAAAIAEAVYRSRQLRFEQKKKINDTMESEPFTLMIAVIDDEAVAAWAPSWSAFVDADKPRTTATRYTCYELPVGAASIAWEWTKTRTRARQYVEQCLMSQMAHIEQKIEINHLVREMYQIASTSTPKGLAGKIFNDELREQVHELLDKGELDEQTHPRDIIERTAHLLMTDITAANFGHTADARLMRDAANRKYPMLVKLGIPAKSYMDLDLSALLED